MNRKKFAILGISLVLTIGSIVPAVAAPITSNTKVESVSQTIKEWVKGPEYNVGEKVSYNGKVYECIVAHKRLAPTMKYAWKELSEVVVPAWKENSKYVSGQEVSYNGHVYVCTVDHARLKPTTKYVWKLVK